MRKLKKRTIGSIVVALLCLLVFIAVGLRNGIVVTRYDIYDDRVKEDFKIVLITDTHSCSYGDGQKELIEKVDLEKPDIILLGGDIVDDRLPMEKGLETVEYLSKLCPAFYVAGNHEVWSEKLTEIKEAVRERGAVVLEGTFREVEIKGNQVVIAGIDDPVIGEEE